MSIALLSVVGVAAAGGAGLSCASEEEEPLFEQGDAAPESAADDAGPVGDAGPSDAPVTPVRDAAPFDGGQLPIACTSSPCAKALVTTRPPVDYEYHEGYCALLDDGTVACWGANGYGQLGRGDDAGTTDSATAKRVEGLSEVTQLDHTCAVDKGGAVWCWGTGAILRNDAGASTTERAPVKLALPPAKRVAMGLDMGCALLHDGLACWGRNTNGQIAPFDVAPASALLPVTAIGLAAGAPLRNLLVGKATFAVRDDGVTLSWGANPPLGRISSMAPDPNPMPIPLEGITSLDLTSDNACATAAGIGYCWGVAITQPDHYVRAVPEPIAMPEPIVQIATTRAFNYASAGVIVRQTQRWCAVGASGAVYCWGRNAVGQAGDGTKDQAYEPVEVKGLPATAAEVRTQPDSTCALLTTGKVYCWGSNYYGQLGNGKMRMPSVVPQEVVLP